MSTALSETGGLTDVTQQEYHQPAPSISTLTPPPDNGFDHLDMQMQDIASIDTWAEATTGAVSTTPPASSHSGNSVNENSLSADVDNQSSTCTTTQDVKFNAIQIPSDFDSLFDLDSLDGMVPCALPQESGCFEYYTISSRGTTAVARSTSSIMSPPPLPTSMTTSTTTSYDIYNIGNAGTAQGESSSFGLDLDMIIDMKALDGMSFDSAKGFF